MEMRDRQISMFNPKKPFRLNVGFIIHEEVGYTHEFPFEFDQVWLGGDLGVKKFTGGADIGRATPGVILTGQFFR